jgi:hypothetical protein
MAPPFERRDQSIGRLLAAARIVEAELHEEEPASRRQQLEIRRPFPSEAVDHGALESFEADRVELEDFSHVVGGGKRVRVAESHERAMLRTLDEPDRGLENNRARPFGSDERARDMKSALRQQLVEVVARHAPRNRREALPDEDLTAIADAPQPAVDLATPASALHNRVELIVARRADGQFRAVVQQHAQLLDVVDGLPGEQGVRAARVVANHAAEGAAAVGRRIGTERQLKGFGSSAQRIEHDARLDARKSAARVHVEDRIHVLAEVEDDGDVAALAGKAGPGAARENRRLVRPTRRDGGRHIGGVARNDEADRNLAVVRGVGCIKRTAAAIEPHFAANRALQIAFELGSLRKRLGGQRLDRASCTRARPPTRRIEPVND